MYTCFWHLQLYIHLYIHVHFKMYISEQEKKAQKDMQQTVNGVHSEEWYSMGVICFIFCLFSFCHCFIFFVMRFKIKKIQTCVYKRRFLLSLLFSFPSCFFFTHLEMFNSVLLYCWNFLCQGIEIRSSGNYNYSQHVY